MSHPIPQYISDVAAKTAHEHLPHYLQNSLSVNQVERILELRHICDDDFHLVYRNCEREGMGLSEDGLHDVFEAEHVYYRQIGAMK